MSAKALVVADIEGSENRALLSVPAVHPIDCINKPVHPQCYLPHSYWFYLIRLTNTWLNIHTFKSPNTIFWKFTSVKSEAANHSGGKRERKNEQGGDEGEGGRIHLYWPLVHTGFNSIQLQASITLISLAIAGRCLGEVGEKHAKCELSAEVPPPTFRVSRVRLLSPRSPLVARSHRQIMEVAWMSLKSLGVEACLNEAWEFGSPSPSRVVQDQRIVWPWSFPNGLPRVATGT